MKCSKKCPYGSFAKTMVDGLDVIKNVPIGCKSRRVKKLGYPKRCNYLCANGGTVNIMGYHIIYPSGFVAESNKKCDWILAPKTKSAFRKTCLPLKG